jgi:HK97 gp10 family phage protein
VSSFKASAVFTPRGAGGRFVPVVLAPAAAEGVNAALKVIYDRSQDLVAVDTGALKASGKINEAQNTGLSVSGSVEYTEPYAAFLEFGTGIRGAESAGAGAGPYNPKWPGMAAQPFMRPAIDESHDEVKEAISTTLRSVL